MSFDLRTRVAVRHLISLTAIAAVLSCGGDEGGGGTTEPTPNPAPTINYISRDTATAGSSTFSVVLGGADFMPGVVGTFDGFPRTTSRLSSGSIGFALTAGDLSAVGDHEIRAKNPDPTTGPSAPVTFHVLAPPPVPVIDSLSPDTVTAGGSAFTLHVHGVGFTLRSVIRSDGAPLTTVRHGPTHLSAPISSAEIATAGTFQITVFTPVPGGGSSIARPLVVIAPPPPPTITGIDPDTITIGPDSVALTLRGTGFTGIDSILVANQGNERRRPASATSDTLLSVTLDLSWLSSLGIPQVRVHGPNGWSAFYNGLEAINPIPVIDSLLPDTLDATQAADTFVVAGSGFVNGMTVWLTGGYAVSSVTWLDFRHLRVIVPQATMMAGGQLPVRVHDPLDYHTSDSALITLRTPAAQLDSIGPSVVLQGSSDTTLAVSGHNFAFRGTLTVNGTPVPTMVYTANFATSLLPASFMAASDTLLVRFENPAPTVSASAALPLVVAQANLIPILDSLTPGVVLSDTGLSTVTVHGSRFVDGSLVEATLGLLGGSPVDTIPTTVLDDSTLTFQVPASMLHAGWRPQIRVRAPAPTAGISAPLSLRIWTSGIDSMATRSILGYARGMVSDTLRGVIYAVGADSAGGRLIAIDSGSGTVLQTLHLPDAGTAITLAPQGDRLYVTSYYGAFLTRVDLASWTADWTIPLVDDSGAIIFAAHVVPSPIVSGTFTVLTNGTGVDDATAWGYNTRVYDGQIPRGPFRPTPTSIYAAGMFGDTLILTGSDMIFRGVLDSTGVTLVDSVAVASPTFGPYLFLSPDRLAVSGRLLDAHTGTTVASGAALEGYLARGDRADRYFVAERSITGSAFTKLDIRSVSVATGAVLGAVTIDLDWMEYLLGFGVTKNGMMIGSLTSDTLLMLRTELTGP